MEESGFEILDDEAFYGEVVFNKEYPLAAAEHLRKRGEVFNKINNEAIKYPPAVATKFCYSCLLKLSSQVSATEQTLLQQEINYNSAIQRVIRMQVDTAPCNDDDINVLLREIIQLKDEVSYLEESHDEMRSIFSDCNREEYSLNCAIDSMKRAINNSQYELQSVTDALQASLDVTERSTHELHSYFDASSSLFDFCTDEISLSINSLRLQLIPDTGINLNWSEINAAWSTLCTALLSYQNLHDLLHKEKRSSYTYYIVPLRRRAIIISNVQKASYCLEGSGKNIAHYCTAILALAVLFTEIASSTSRFDALQGSLKDIHIAGRSFAESIKKPAAPLLDALMSRFATMDSMRALLHDIFDGIKKLICEEC